ncbi:HAD family hydrolase [Bradyrhizobium ottawaense]
MMPALVFDWNGTLLDDTYALLETTNVILDRFGRPSIDINTFREHCDVPLDRLYRSLGMSQEEVEAVERDEGALFHDTYEPLADKADLREGARRVLALARARICSTHHPQQPHSRASTVSAEETWSG